MESDSGWVWIKKWTEELKVSFRWIYALPSLDSSKQDKFYVPRSAAWLLVTGKHCLQKLSSTFCRCACTKFSGFFFASVWERRWLSLGISRTSWVYSLYYGAENETRKQIVYGRRNNYIAFIAYLWELFGGRGTEVET